MNNPDIYDTLIEIKARLNQLVFTPQTIRQQHKEADEIRRLLNTVIKQLADQRAYLNNPDEDAYF